MMDWSKPGKGEVVCTQQVGQEKGGRMHGVSREEGKGSEGRQWICRDVLQPAHISLPSHLTLQHHYIYMYTVHWYVHDC